LQVPKAMAIAKSITLENMENHKLLGAYAV